MGNKIFVQTLAEQLATERHISKTAAEGFVKAFFDTIVTVLEKEKVLKIKGWGTFKLVEVDTRESVDVNTGERISIDGHQKVTFLPDNVLKKKVNKPFEQFETVIINEGVDLESMESLDNNVVAAASKEHIENDDMPSSTESASSIAPVHTHEAESLSIDDNEAESTADNKVLEHVIHPMQMQLEIKHDPSDNQKTAEAFGRERNENRWLRILLLLLTAIVLCAASYFVGYYKILCPGCDTEIGKTQVLSRTPVRKTPSSDGASVRREFDDKIHEDSLAVGKNISSIKVEKKMSSVKKSVEREKTLDPSVNYRMVSTMETHEMREGDNLYRLARHYYGSKKFVVYIIKYNNFEDPDLVTVGTKVKIPRLKK